MSVKLELCRSRWGFHPCDYATFCTLRKLHKAMWRVCYELGRLRAWERKQPQNRRGPRPQVCPASLKYLDVRVKGSTSPYDNGYRASAYAGWTGNEVIVPDRELIRLFQEARHPQAEQGVLWQTVQPSWNPGKWDTILAEIEEWYQTH